MSDYSDNMFSSSLSLLIVPLYANSIIKGLGSALSINFTREKLREGRKPIFSVLKHGIYPGKITSQKKVLLYFMFFSIT